MQLRLRTKLTLVMTGLVFLVVVTLSGVYFARLTSHVIQETNNRANELTQQVFAQAKRALADAKQSGMQATSDAPEDRRDYVRQGVEGKDGFAEGMQTPHGSDLWFLA